MKSAPPIADPHSTHHLPPDTAPRTPGTVLMGLIHVILGVPTFAAGATFVVFVIYLQMLGKRAPDVVAIAIGGAIGVFMCVLGFALIWHGLRIWRHGR